MRLSTGESVMQAPYHLDSPIQREPLFKLSTSVGACLVYEKTRNLVLLVMINKSRVILSARGILDPSRLKKQV